MVGIIRGPLFLLRVIGLLIGLLWGRVSMSNPANEDDISKPSQDA